MKTIRPSFDYSLPNVFGYIVLQLRVLIALFVLVLYLHAAFSFGLLGHFKLDHQRAGV